MDGMPLNDHFGNYRGPSGEHWNNTNVDGYLDGAAAYCFYDDRSEEYLKSMSITWAQFTGFMDGGQTYE